MPMNFLQGSISPIRLFNLENSFVMSSGSSSHALCTFLFSRLSMFVLISVLGQLDGSCESRCGPVQNRVDVDSFVGSNLLK